MNEMRSGGRFIAEFLKAHEVSHVFFVMAILRRGLVEMEEVGIRRILTHSEKAAAYMADGYSRVSRKPGVCMAQSVGAANLASGLQDPYFAHSAVIAITGRKPPVARYRNAYQELDHRPLFDPVTKFNADIDTIEQLPLLLAQAFREATSGAPRPVHLDLLGYAGEFIEAGKTDVSPHLPFPSVRYPSSRPIPDPESVERAAEMLRASQRPVIVAGGGAIASAAEADIRKLAELLSIPVAASNDGKGTVPDKHPLSIGVMGSYSAPHTNRIVSEADLVLFIGSGTGDQVTHNWTVPSPETPVIQIDIDPREAGRSYPRALPVCGDARTAVRQLIGLLSDPNPRRKWAEHAAKITAEWKESIAPLQQSDAVPIRPERLCRELSAILPPDGILVSDTGYSTVWTSTMVELSHSGQRYLRAAGSLGWAFPAAIGAKCALPDRPVICFTGDGGFWYHLSELETAARWNIPVVAVVSNNSCLGQSILGIEAAYGNGPGKREEVCAFNRVNFARIAEEMGCLGIRAEHPAEIAPALSKALSAGRPAVVEVVTDGGSHPPFPWKPS